MAADDHDADRAALQAQATQLADLLDQQRRQVAELERQLADARTAFRRERDAGAERIDADRAEAARLKAEAKRLHAEAAADRARTRKLAGRFVRRVRGGTPTSGCNWPPTGPT